MEKLKVKDFDYSILVENGKLAETFSKNVNSLKDFYHLTLQEIADGSELPIETVKAIIYYENKDYKISVVHNLAKYFGLSIEELTGSDALSPSTIRSIQQLRTLNESYTAFFTTAIEWTAKQTINSEKTVPVYSPKCDPSTGSLKYSIRNISKPLDISDVPDGIRPKILMSLEMPCNHYVPLYYEGDHLLIAKDRNPNPDETVVIVMNGHIWLCNVKYVNENGNIIKKMYSIIDGHYCGNITDAENVFGYVAYVQGK